MKYTGANESRGAVATRETKADVSGESVRNVRTDMETKMPTNMSITKSGTPGRNACSRKVVHDFLRAVERGIPVGRHVKPCLYPLGSTLCHEWGHESAFVLALSMPVCSQQYHRNQRLRCRPCARRRAVRRNGGGGRGGGRGGGPGGDGPGGDSAQPILSHPGSDPHPGVAGPLACGTGATDDRGNASRRSAGSALCEMSRLCGYGAGAPRPMDRARGRARPGRYTWPPVGLGFPLHGVTASLHRIHGGVSCRAS